MVTFTIILISIVANLLPAFLVIFSDPKSIINRYFFALTLAFVSFGLINYISINPFWLDQITWIRLDLFSAVYLFLFLYLTFLVFPERDPTPLNRIDRLFVFYSIFVSLLTLTPVVFSHLTQNNHGVQPVPAPGIALFILQQILSLIITARLCIKRYKKSDRNQKKQLRTIMTGTTIAILTIILFNLIAVQIFHTTILVAYSSLGVLAFTFSFFLALLRYRFLDFRILVARFLAYILLLSSIVGLYALLVFVVASTVFTRESVFTRQVVPILVAIILTFTAPLLKNYFDRVTNEIFYKDAYDPQAFLDELNTSLVNNTEIIALMKHTSDIIERNLKCSFCLTEIDQTETAQMRIVGTNQAHFRNSELQYVTSQLSSQGEKFIARDQLGINDIKLRTILRKNDIAVVIRLVDQNDLSKKAIGSLMLGPKKSGSMYNKQDFRIINIIADQLLIAIQNALRFEEIQGFAAVLQSKVDQATAKLQKTNRQLRSLDEAKDDFISMASHQLRTPLTSIKGYTSMVLEGDAGEITDKQRALLKQSYVSSQRMVYMISDLLNVSRLRTGKFDITPVPVNLADIIEQELDQLKEIAADHSLKLTYRKPKHFPMLMFDETKTRQVIMNFVDNAIHYTPVGGYININLVETPVAVELRVKDNGIGVPRNEQPFLFTKFYRAGNARKARPDGSGLGLFMAKKVIIAQGGALIFHSQPGQGSTFGFVFSKVKHAVPAAPPAA